MPKHFPNTTNGTINRDTFISWISDNTDLCTYRADSSTMFLSDGCCDGPDLKPNCMRTESGKIQYTDTARIDAYVKAYIKETGSSKPKMSFTEYTRNIRYDVN